MAKATTPKKPARTIYDALALSATKSSCGFFLDFDGVLAFIQPEPDSVSPVSGVVEQLARLTPMVKKVAIISARPARFLARHFGSLPAVSLYGMYGLESVVDGVTTTNPAAEKWIPTIRQVKQEAEQELSGGIDIEDKRLSVSLHFRKHPESRHEAEKWAHAKAIKYGLIEQHGRMVVELKPPISIDKGTVLLKEVSDLQSAWYFGDDISDAEGFRALRRRHAEDASFFGVCVAVRNTETGQKLEEQADYTLTSPDAVPSLLASAVDLFSG